VEVAVAASSVEAGAFPGNHAEAAEAARLLAEELIDDGRPLSSASTKEASNEAATTPSVSMSPHRLCRYSNNMKNPDEGESESTSSLESREVFGAHTDASFLTVVPVAAVPGLEVYDEAAEEWYSPEKAARRHYLEAHHERDDNDELPWHAQYVVMMPGELLQVATRNEVLAAVHRVVAVRKGDDDDGGGGSRLSAPVLLRGRPGIALDVARYLGGTLGDPLLEECDGRSVEDIHDAMQPKAKSS